MTTVALRADEGLIMQDGNILHDRGRSKDGWGDELILTSQALIVLHKSNSGKVKEEQRFPLAKVKVVNGVVQVMRGRSECGLTALVVHFVDGIECFALGKSDEDDSDCSLRAIFDWSDTKEKANIDNWCQAITAAVTRLASTVVPGDGFQAGDRGSGEAGRATGAQVTVRCIGCMAPLSGRPGQKVTCRYCDIEQAI